jgi:hypothetical protein
MIEEEDRAYSAGNPKTPIQQFNNKFIHSFGHFPQYTLQRSQHSLQDVTIPKPPLGLDILHFLHLAYPNLPLCRFPIYLPPIHPLHIISHTTTGILAMVYEMEPGSYHCWSL